MAMATDELGERLFTASTTAREAGGMALKAFRERPAGDSLVFKGPQDYLTETDGEVERLIRARITKNFWRDSFFGEEGGGQFGRDVWVVDPIDGTANFARGIPHFCVSIAFVRDLRVEIGVIYDPVHDELYAARRGHGATRNGKPIHVSNTADLARATLEIGWSSRLPPEPYTKLVHEMKVAGANVRRAGSGTLGLAYTADGRQDAYCELHINSWDALAGLLLIEEAGGFVNDFLANDGLSKGNPVLGCTPAIKDPMMRAMGLSR
jgi:myo-inositol-1(or 4)-monophosphatase